MASSSRGKAQRSGSPEGAPRRWPTRDVLRILAIIAGFYITLQLLWVGRSVVMLTFLGVLFGLALAAGVDRLERHRVPRAVGAVLIVLAFVGVLVGIGAVTAPSITGQVRELKAQLPEAIEKIQRWVRERQEGVSQVLERVAPGGAPVAEDQRKNNQAGDQANQPVQGLAGQIGSVGRHLFGFFSSTVAVLGGIVLILFVALFTAIDAQTYQDGLMHLFPHEARPRAREVLSETAVMLRRWLLTQFISMLLVGALTAVVLLLLGIEAAPALGIIAGILEFIPIAGPVIASVPAIAMGFLDGPEKALYVALAYLVIQQSESNLLYPLLMKKGLELPPVLTIFTQGVMSIVFGFIGLLVAVPMLAAVTVPIKMLYVRDVVGDEVKLPGEEEGRNGLPPAEGGGEDGGKVGKSLMILLIGLATLAACSSAEQKLERNNQTVQSWEVTARLTKQLRERGAIPEQYARQVLDAAADQLERTRRSSEKIRR